MANPVYAQLRAIQDFQEQVKELEKIGANLEDLSIHEGYIQNIKLCANQLKAIVEFMNGID